MKIDLKKHYANAKQTPIESGSGEVKYRGLIITPRREGGKSNGFLVTDGICNIMPGGCWFETIQEAEQGIRVLKRVAGDGDRFWEIMQPFEYKRLGQKVPGVSENCTISHGRFHAEIKNHRVVKLWEDPIRK
jgi:hypothetical protein